MPEDFEEPPLPYGRWYYRWCKELNRRFGPEEDSVRRKVQEQTESFQHEQERFRTADTKFAEIQSKYLSTEPEYRKGEKALATAQKRFDAARKRFEQPAFRSAVGFLGWDLAVRDVLFFAMLVTLLVFLPSFVAFLVWLLLGNPDFISALTVGPVVLLAVPLGLFGFLANFPESMAKRVRVYSLGRSPEAVSYLVMSMHLVPSLNRAVAFAAENSEEPIASAFGKVSWDVYVRRFPTIEESFLHMAQEWGEWNGDLRRSLHAIRAATLEQTPEGLDRALEKANDIILTGTKQKVETFVAGLSAPTTVLFALGILLPMTIGAALPLLSTSFDPSAFAQVGVGARAAPAPTNPAPLILLMDIAFPFAAFAYAYYILGQRPGTSSPPEVPSTLTRPQRRSITFVSLALGIGFAAFGALLLLTLPAAPGTGALELIHRVLGPLLIVWGASLGLGYYFVATTRVQKRKRDEILALEEEFPDGLFQLGSRIAEGNAPERAIEMTARALGESRVGKLFDLIALRTKVTRTTLREALYGEDGLLRTHPSRAVRAAMRVVVEMSSKDARTAGRMIVGVSNYLKDMKKIEHDLRTSLKAGADNMKATGIIFAPLVMGVTVALYAFLFSTFSDLGDVLPAAMVPVPVFQLMIGIYLLATVLAITYFVAGIEWGEDWVERKYLMGSALPVSAVLFTLTSLGAQLFFGG